MSGKKRLIAAVLFTTIISGISTQASAGLLTNTTNTLISTTNTVLGVVDSAVNAILDLTYNKLTATAATLDNTIAKLPSPLACAAAYSTLVNAANAQLSVDLQVCAAAHVSTTDPLALTDCTNNAVSVSSAAINNALAATQTCLSSHLQ